MNTYDFIFSNRPRYRISRHVIFWFAWFVFMLVAYHFPRFIFPDWYTGFTENFTPSVLEKLGGFQTTIPKIVIRQSWVLMLHGAFTYAVIYFILPRYLSGNKKWYFTTLLLILIFAVFAIAHSVLSIIVQIDHRNQLREAGLKEVKVPEFLGNIGLVMWHIAFQVTTLLGLATTIKLVKYWWIKKTETELAAKEKANAELQLLKAQIHPHFLFNSLNNIYSFALEASPVAPQLIQKLSGLLRYMLEECNQALVPLEKELRMIQDYIALEKVRYGERLKLQVNIDDQFTPHINGKIWREQPIAPLVLIPFVENCFKHGTSKMLSQQWVNLDITIRDSLMIFKLENSRLPGSESIPVNGHHGVGLKNVRKRLELLYPGRHELEISVKPNSWCVLMKIVLAGSGSLNPMASLKKGNPAYELE